MVVNGISRIRQAAILAAGMLVMMAVVGLVQYLVSANGKISPGAMVAISVPSGILLGRSWAAKAAKKN